MTPKHASLSRPVIEASWRRCRDFGLDHGSRPMLDIPPAGEVVALRDGHRQLIETASLEVMPFYESILSNSQSLILLTDAKGHVLNDWGDHRHMDAARKPLFRHGTCWQECLNGTNAVGTSIAAGEAVQVLRDEHFLKDNRFMIGSAAPILDPSRRLLGVLNVSSDTYLPQAHTLGMVKLMTQSIENRLLTNSYQAQHFVLVFNSNLDNIDSQWSGLLAFDEAGLIVAANRRADRMAGRELAGQRIEEVMGCKLATLKDQAERSTVTLRLNARQTVYGLVKRPVARPQSGALPCAKADSPKAGDPISLAHIGFGDPRIARCIKQAECVIDKDIPILVRGETGVGKEVFVKALHQRSSRRAQPFVAINCAAIPADLVESELFGYERGAFTGAHNKGAIGLIRKAHRGTLFLDEIGEMPLSAQARLLRVLQERVVTPLGSTESVAVDIKVITATNRSLRAQVSEGTFRQDLFYRISGLSLELPPLRERADKGALFRELHQRYSDGAAQPMTNEVVALFELHPWPGNIRQLINVLQVGLAMAGGEALQQWHLPDDFFIDLDEMQGGGMGAANDEHHPAPTEDRVMSIQATSIVPAHDMVRPQCSADVLGLYREYKGNVSRVARELQLSRNTVYKRLREQGLR